MKMDDLKLPAKLTRSSLKAMPLGGTVESEGLFQGVSAEPVVWELVSTHAFGKEYTFDLTYFGVKISQIHIWVNKDGSIRMEEM
jgi:hypothetical protein